MYELLGLCDVKIVFGSRIGVYEDWVKEDRAPISEWHTEKECNFFKSVKLLNGLHPMTMVQNVGSLLALRAFMKRTVDTQAWKEFMQLETHLQERKGTSIWEFSKNTVRVRNVFEYENIQKYSESVITICH